MRYALTEAPILVPRWGDLQPADDWHVVESTITSVSPVGYQIEVIARGPGQRLSRAHKLVYEVAGHNAPAPDLQPVSASVVEARPSPIPAISWLPVKEK